MYVWMYILCLSTLLLRHTEFVLYFVLIRLYKHAKRALLHIILCLIIIVLIQWTTILFYAEI